MCTAALCLSMCGETCPRPARAAATRNPFFTAATGLRPAVCDRDCFGVHFAEPLAQGFPCVRHCAYDRAARLVHYISRPQLAHLRSLRSCQLCDDCRRKTTSLARVRGVKPESPALSLVLEHDDELSF